ncbi:hypothetical protein [Pantanalinema sp. GBBB05]|uniref:hypothetical protein n=1 Tax=Pantanalinema sp. GBBB05 TaxID=2604139 RepID=UPI001D599E5D|nr:site-specific integrase [Pantanalinema sp. GBBB05]
MVPWSNRDLERLVCAVRLGSRFFPQIELAQIWQILKFEEKTDIRDRIIVAVRSHGLRASETANLNVEHWNGKILKVHRSKGRT